METFLDKTHDNVPVVVLGMGPNSPPVLKHLVRSGYRVIHVGRSREEKAYSSRYGEKRILPDPLRSPDDWIAAMLALGLELGQGAVLLPLSDPFVIAIDAAAEQLDQSFRFLGFGSGLRTSLVTKDSAFKLAEQHDFPRPKTILIEDEESLRALMSTVGGPCLIKPASSHEWLEKEAQTLLGSAKAIVAENPEELVNIYQRARKVSTKLIAQEVIPGPDSNLLYWAGFVSKDQGVAGRIVGRKLRTYPPHLGSASFVRLEDAPEVEAQCEAFLVALGYEGICGIEMKVDPRDGIAKLIEVNARYGLWDILGVPAGVDLVGDAIQHALGNPSPPSRPSSFNFRWVDLMRDFAAYRIYSKEGSLSLSSWFYSLRPPMIVADLPLLSDPRYAAKNLLRRASAIRSLETSA